MKMRHSAAPRQGASQRYSATTVAGGVALGLSAIGYPMTQRVISHWGRAGAVVVESVCAALLIRDAALASTGVTTRLRPIPAALLWVEIGAATASAVAGIRPVLDGRAAAASARPDPDRMEHVRRGSTAALFVVHTLRFWIYLQPDRGRREAGQDHG
jgi:hypothetical protein